MTKLEKKKKKKKEQQSKSNGSKRNKVIRIKASKNGEGERK